MQVPFHGRSVRGWVLEATRDVPARMLDVTKAVSPVRFFDADLLGLARWVSERYVAPLATVLGRMTPPRVASEEGSLEAGAWLGAGGGRAPLARPSPTPLRAPTAASVGEPAVADHLSRYSGGAGLVASLRNPRAASSAYLVRPAPDEEVAVAVEAVATCLASGRRAVVIVPEAAPVPATAGALVEAFGERVALYLGGSKRVRYRRWLEIAAGRYDVVVGTRPAVFAPLGALGSVFVSRESHPAHREDRAPYYHVRDVALARAERAGAVCLLSALCPSSEAAALGLPDVAPTRRRWPPVEVVKPGSGGQAPRLVRALRDARRGFLLAPRPGYGVAAVCRSCGEPAACAACAGLLRMEDGVVRCVVCAAPGRCARCGGGRFGIRRGGAERVQEWAARATEAHVRRLGADDVPRLPSEGEVLVGGPDDVRDLGPGGLDLVGILDADLAERRPGLAARERALTTWMEAVAWACPDGRAVVQASRTGDPAVQALVRGNPDRFHGDEARRRAEAGFPVGSAVFRIVGSADLAGALADLATSASPTTSLVTSLGDQTVCLLALDPARVPAFGRAVRALAVRDVVTRVEAEPHL